MPHGLQNLNSRPGIKPGSWHWKLWVLTTGHPGNSPPNTVKCNINVAIQIMWKEGQVSSFKINTYHFTLRWSFSCISVLLYPNAASFPWSFKNLNTFLTHFLFLTHFFFGSWIHGFVPGNMTFIHILYYRFPYQEGINLWISLGPWS